MDKASQYQDILWTTLVVDPAHPAFLKQKVAPATSSCPAGSCVGDSIWYFPARAASSYANCHQRIDWHQPMGDGLLTDPEFAYLLLTAKVYALLLMSRPRTKMRRVSTVKSHLSHFFHLCDHIADGPYQEGREKIADLDGDDIFSFVDAISARWTPEGEAFRRLLDVVRDVDHFFKKGLLADGFAKVGLPQVTETILDIGGFTTPSDGAYEPSLFSSPPLSDEYCCTMLDISDFINDHYAEAIIENAAILKEMRRVERDECGLLPRGDYWDPMRARLQFAEHAKHYPWPRIRAPFKHRYSWPPRSTLDLERAMKSMQGANMQRLSFELGLRRGENVATEQSCLATKIVAGVEATFFSTIRFKHAITPGGDPIELRITNGLAKALKLQIELAKALGVEEGIWSCTRLEHLGNRLVSTDVWLLRAFAREHELEGIINEVPFRRDLTKEDADPDIGGAVPALSLQRFRATIARIIMVQGRGHVRLVKRMLGHRRIQTSLGYVRQSPFIQEEIALAKRRRLLGSSQNVPPADPLLIHELKEELDASTFDGMLDFFREQEGQAPILVAPGVLVSAKDIGGSLADLDPADLSAATLAFAISHLADKKVLARPNLHSWLREQATRLACRSDVRALFAPSTVRERAAYDELLRGIGIA